MGILVRAKVLKPDEKRVMVGYYNHQRRFQGEEFEIEHESQFSTTWMERIAEPSAADPVASESRAKAGKAHKAMQASQVEG